MGYTQNNQQGNNEGMTKKMSHQGLGIDSYIWPILVVYLKNMCLHMDNSMLQYHVQRAKTSKILLENGDGSETTKFILRRYTSINLTSRNGY